MAALRAARDARRASGGSRRFARSAAGPDVAGVGVAEDELAPARRPRPRPRPARDATARPRVAAGGSAVLALRSRASARPGWRMTRRRGGRQEGRRPGRLRDAATTSAGTTSARTIPAGRAAGDRSGGGVARRRGRSRPRQPGPAASDLGGDGAGGRFEEIAPGTSSAAAGPVSASSRRHGTWWATGAPPGGATMRTRGLIGGPRPDRRPRRPADWSAAGRAGGSRAVGDRRRGGPGRSRSRQGPARSGRPAGRRVRRRRCRGRAPGPSRHRRTRASCSPTGWNRDTGEWERAARAERARSPRRARLPG